MTTNSWIAAVRRKLSVVSAAASLAAISLSTSTAAADEPLVTRIGRFQIPFDVEAEPGQPVEGFAVLFGSQDGGQTWEQLQSVPAAQGKFTFNAPRDGRYSFAIRVADAQGNLSATDMQGAQPEMEVIVDTVAPELKLELFDSNPGQVIVSWTCNDSTADPSTLGIEFADAADGRWKPVQFQAAVNGQAIVSVSPGRAISVRATISDAAGNRSDATAQTTSRPGTAAASPTVGGPATPRSTNPLGPSPFAGDARSSQPAAVNYPSVTPSSGPPAIPHTATQPGSRDVSQVPLPSASPATFPASMPMTSTVATPANPGESQVVNTSVFDIDYSVEDVGPSGVSAVELFVTEDGGQNWFKYGTDADLKSPFTVDTMGEGTFGFAVRVRNGLGFSDTPPQPGQAPEITVTVDTSAPRIEFAQPTVKADGFATIQLQWRVGDQNPSTTPVRLEYAASPAGPWTPVFDWQVDQGGFQWAVRPGTPASVYFRLLARDSAGNVSSSAPPQPVMVDMKKPVGRLIRVQTVSQPGSANFIR